MADQRSRVGVFIDGENVAASQASRIMQVAGLSGLVVERRVYGNFAAANLKPWLDVAPEHALSPHATIQAQPGKNCADIALVVDAVELLIGGEIDVFFLATSDSDFTHLAMRIRQRGKKAIGIGSQKAAVSLMAAFDEFQFLEEKQKPAVTVGTAAMPAKKASAGLGIFPLLQRVLVAEKVAVGQWMDVSALGTAIRKVVPGFRSQNYGSAKLSSVLKNCPAVEVRLNESKSMQVRIRPIQTVSATAQA